MDSQERSFTMLPLALLKWKSRDVSPKSHSLLVDFNQIHVRNLFLFCFALSISRQYFGENINCQIDGHRVSQSFLDTKCFINGTLTNFSGVQEPILPVLYHDYYQWVSIVLLLQAISFHLPFRLWSKNIHSYVQELTIQKFEKSECDRVFNVITSSKGNGIFWKIWTLECFYAAQLICQIFLLNLFFHRVWSLSRWSWSAIPILFPEMGTCIYDYFSGGGQTAGRFRCLLPLNSVYRKVFFVIYGLFAILLVLHKVFFLYRLFLTIRLGPKWINMWWSLQIAQDVANSWHGKQTLNRKWRRFTDKTESLESDYVSMELQKVECNEE
ncbi:innexin [Trichonephila inaurata madagascariensis]|uniref:Innexin n=1 Tax=Trichonephila inaurata madagascariensis TaxID=2747483 RepID=A0A8X7CCK8_9ARAC|nr:innexin [Trichonephila inaurata madagascariensis]